MATQQLFTTEYKSIKEIFTIMASQKTSVLFVCLGNICRSPIAEAVFTKLVNDMGASDKWEIDSAAIIDYHTGKNPDRRAQKCMKDHDVPMNHKARPIVTADFNKFDYIFGMDNDNMRDLTGIAPENCSAKIELLGKYHPEDPGVIIRDPYYDDGSEGFEVVYHQCVQCCKAFLDKFK